jgi:peptide-methionine (S)-S-oxide reductase
MILMCLAGWACGSGSADLKRVPEPEADLVLPADAGPQEVVLAGGCFWCTEAVFEQLVGVSRVESGYVGGARETADYSKVSSGATQHAEAIRVTYDPNKISYGQLLKIFFTVAHDPTQLDRQGPDTGKQYRSAVFYAGDEQKRVTEAYIHQLEDARVFDSPIVTALEPLEDFYPAEAYHQDYVRLNPNQPYVRQQALPKVDKVRKLYADRVKPDSEL